MKFGGDRFDRHVIHYHPTHLVLDTLRCLFVMGVVLLHAAESQMTLENEWAVDDPRITSVADQLVVFLDVILMSALFFVAGYFTLPTLRRRGAAGFLWRKFWNLVIPGAMAVVLLNSMWKYVFHLTRSWEAGETPMGYWEAWWFFLSSIQWTEVGNIHAFNFTLLHVWFITVLVVFYLAVQATAWYRRRPTCPSADHFAMKHRHGA